MSRLKKAYKLALLLLSVLAISPVWVGAESKEVLGLSGPSIDEVVFLVVPSFGLDVEMAALRTRQIDMIPKVQTLSQAQI